LFSDLMLRLRTMRPCINLFHAHFISYNYQYCYV
jgi:hypothetical protein